jgi:hypothetical protein
VGLLAACAVAAAPLTFVVGMMLTPVLWRLESVVGIELAGHSGPSDWVFETIFVLFTIVLFFALQVTIGRRQPGASPDVPPPKGGDPR